VIPRVPLIPGFTLDEANFRQILAFLAPLSCRKFIFCRFINTASPNITYWEKNGRWR
jgi:pyruvate-formate lyase-activating enzyme